MTEAWKRFKGDFNSMTDEEIAKEVSEAQERIDKDEEWIEAVTAWKAAGSPRRGEWIKHNGGEMPVSPSAKVLIKCRNEALWGSDPDLDEPARACNLRWVHFDLGGDIVEYKEVVEYE